MRSSTAKQVVYDWLQAEAITDDDKILRKRHLEMVSILESALPEARYLIAEVGDSTPCLFGATIDRAYCVQRRKADSNGTRLVITSGLVKNLRVTLDDTATVSSRPVVVLDAVEHLRVWTFLTDDWSVRVETNGAGKREELCREIAAHSCAGGIRSGRSRLLRRPRWWAVRIRG